MTRREFLVGAGSAISLAFAGCLSADNSDEPSSENESDDEVFDPDVEPARRLGQGPGVSFEATPERAYEYLEASDRVQIRYDSGDTSVMAFDRWGTARATDHGADRLQSILNSKSLTGTGIGIGQGRVEVADIEVSSGEERPTQDEFKRAAPLSPSVYHSHDYARDGSLISEPDVPFQRIIEETPRSMEITMLFPEKEYTAVLPAVCHRTWSKNE